MIFIHVMNVQAEGRRQSLLAWSHATDQTATSEKGRLARALLRYSASDYGGFPDAGRWVFSRTPSGRPLLDTPGTPAIGVSFSHSGDWIACALNSEGPIGVDIEIHRPDRNLQGIAELGFSAREVQRCQGSVQEFYRIWCLREAIAKATGMGLAQATNRQDYADAGPFVGSWQAAVANQTWDLTHALAAESLSVACATPADPSMTSPQPRLTVTA